MVGYAWIAISSKKTGMRDYSMVIKLTPRSKKYKNLNIICQLNQ